MVLEVIHLLHLPYHATPITPTAEIDRPAHRFCAGRRTRVPGERLRSLGGARPENGRLNDSKQDQRTINGSWNGDKCREYIVRRMISFQFHGVFGYMLVPTFRENVMRNRAADYRIR